MVDEMAQMPLSSDYFPRRQDSHRQYTRPETSFLEFFEQSLVHASPYCTDSRCCSFENDSPTPSLGHGGSEAALEYPLLLFADLQDLPPRGVLLDLIQSFQNTVVPSLPFLEGVSAVAMDNDKSHFHLRLCKAVLGAATSSRPHQRGLSQKLWHPCASLVTGTVELDNSLGRVTDWLAAATLLIAVGVMQSKLDWWRQTNCISGYVQVTIFRGDCLRSSSKSQAQALARTEITALQCFYFLVDTIRSIQSQSPSTVDPTWSAKIGKDGQYEHKALSDSMVLEGSALPPNLSTNDYLLVLLDILSTINTLFCSLGPLVPASDVVQQTIIKLQNQERSSIQEHGSATINPHVPLTANREVEQLSSDLERSLDLWQTSLETSGLLHGSLADPESLRMLPLLHFAKLLLAAGPCVYALPVLAGYTSEPQRTLAFDLPLPCAPHLIGIRVDEVMVQHAVDILEAVETEHHTSGASYHGDTQQRLNPMWQPLALFYGALVVWARMKDNQEDKSGRHALLLPKRLVQSFYTELHKIENHWDCAKRMAEIVKTLVE